jgi:hypothetical protein
MSTIDKITLKVKRLSEEKQEKVLEYVEVLEGLQKEKTDWNAFSLASAFTGLETDDMPEYSEKDLKEKWN